MKNKLEAFLNSESFVRVLSEEQSRFIIDFCEKKHIDTIRVRIDSFQTAKFYHIDRLEGLEAMPSCFFHKKAEFNDVFDEHIKRIETERRLVTWIADTFSREELKDLLGYDYHLNGREEKINFLHAFLESKPDQEITALAECMDVLEHTER